LVSEVLISSSLSDSSMCVLPLPSTMPIQNQTRSKASQMESQLGVKDYGDFSLQHTKVKKDSTNSKWDLVYPYMLHDSWLSLPLPPKYFFPCDCCLYFCNKKIE
jgi:hypothetical protein